MKIKNILITTLAFISIGANADYAPKWTGSGTIEGLYVDMRENIDRVLVRHSVPRQQDGAGADDCDNNGNYYELMVDSRHSDRAYSVMLSAKATTEQIQFYLKGCSATGYPLILIVDTINTGN